MGLEDGTTSNSSNVVNVEFTVTDAVLQQQDTPLFQPGQGMDQSWTSYNNSFYKVEPVPENEWLQDSHALPSSSYVTLDNVSTHVGQQTPVSESYDNLITYDTNGSVCQLQTDTTWSSEFDNCNSSFIPNNSVSNPEYVGSFANETAATTELQTPITYQSPTVYNEVKPEPSYIAAEIKPEPTYITTEAAPVQFTTTQSTAWPTIKVESFVPTSNNYLTSNDSSMQIANNNLDFIFNMDSSTTDSGLQALQVNNAPMHVSSAPLHNTGLQMQNNVVYRQLIPGNNTYNQPLKIVQQPSYEVTAQKTRIAPEVPPAPRVKKSSTCTVCGKVLAHSFSLKRHMRIHTGERPYNCDICDQNFSTSDGLTRHKQRHLKNKPFNCDICYMPFINFADLRRHIQRGSCGASDSEGTSETGKAYKCNECLKAFTTNHALQSHMRTHTGEKPFECDECGKKFSQSSSLVAHKRIHTGEKPFKCDKCGMSYAFQSNYAVHPCFRSHEKTFKCEVCDKTFRREGSLTAHAYMHTGGKPYTCDVCGKAFCYSSNLQTHKRWHTGEKFVCHVCDKSFGKAYNLKLHMRLHTGEKPYECGVCGKRFRSLSHQSAHIKSHTWKKPFECDVCQKKFRLERQLTIHKYIHTGEKPYKCERCDKAFNHLFSLERHKLTIHERKRPPGIRGRKRKNKNNVPYTNYGRKKVPAGMRRVTRLSRRRREQEQEEEEEEETTVAESQAEESKKEESSDDTKVAKGGKDASTDVTQESDSSVAKNEASDNHAEDSAKEDVEMNGIEEEDISDAKSSVEDKQCIESKPLENAVNGLEDNHCTTNKHKAESDSNAISLNEEVGTN